MKRINYAGGSIVTGNAVAAALLDHATQIASNANSSTVDIPVLEDDGSTSIHTLLVGPTTQFDVSDAEGISADEEQSFPVPDLPVLGMAAVTLSPAAESRATSDAQLFDQAVDELEEGLAEGRFS
ncbi:hypothetical protein [Lacisediminihabitans profunda]|uniref:Uncharacterized protein n=1 Tax=Lacisediminihabitans profunda TaxID=2594790 RepID=A0A5C8UNV1_9MICO|nr:hypothetical protein [Lacisediminihabitans profunda]TXN29903.1 hypothetical protein FVP33_12255 [Lacisediminihabitans profunda]